MKGPRDKGKRYTVQKSAGFAQRSAIGSKRPLSLTDSSGKKGCCSRTYNIFRKASRPVLFSPKTPWFGVGDHCDLQNNRLALKKRLEYSYIGASTFEAPILPTIGYSGFGTRATIGLAPPYRTVEARLYSLSWVYSIPYRTVTVCHEQPPPPPPPNTHT